MSLRVAGVDLGKATLKVVIARAGDDARTLSIDSVEVIPHEGAPFERFADWYRRSGAASCAALAATGLHAGALAAPALVLPEDACLEAALAARPGGAPGPVNLASVGARGYAVLTRDAAGRCQHLASDKCSSGTGETLIKTAARFGLSLADADRAAAAAPGIIPITARCSVFAKSELTHFANQGRPGDQLLAGAFDAVARYLAALLARIQVPGPLLLCGGGSRLATLRARLGEHAGREVVVPEHALAFEALGAAAIALEQARAAAPAPLPEDPAALVHATQARIETLPSARLAAARVTVLSARPAPPGAAEAPCVLGIDIGSTGAKAVLTTVAGGDFALHVYDRTRGNPVDAAQRLTRAVLAQVRPDVRAIAVTGSGREAAATVLRAAYPGAAARIFVANEIVAHATAAIRCDDDHGASLSIVEIGGQDAKFAQVAHGQVIESDMNRACSAGTGSFLEEQAALYDVHDISEQTRLAAAGEHPPDLGQMCTVFVAEAAAQAHEQGFGLADLFAGFQYAVIHNYLHRVMGQRTFGRRIFFQGKPASGASLAWTLAAVTGREVIVPPNPGEMGAWGIGLCAIDELGAGALAAAPPFDLGAFLDARAVAKSEFQCKDPGCATLCPIERTTVAVRGASHVVFSGGACPKFEVSVASRPKLAEGAPSPFDERDALLARWIPEQPAPGAVAVPLTGTLAGVLPFVVTFLRELGLAVRVLRPDAHSLARGEERCMSYDACAPVKIAHGVSDAGAARLFFPKIIDLPDREGPAGCACASEQALPNLVDRAIAARGGKTHVIAPELSLASRRLDARSLVELARAARELGAPVHRVPRAARHAVAAQAGFQRGLAAIGRGALAYGRATGTPVVVVCGALHVIADRAVNAGIPEILRQNGALPLPMDCYPVPREIPALPQVAWADANRALRVALAARARGDVYPLYLTAFGCGPASFVEQIFARLMRGYPHTVLESDGHGGSAGYVTRVQAFLYGVRKASGQPSPVPAAWLRLFDDPPPGPTPRDAQVVTIPLSDRIGELSAAVWRSMGHDAVPAGPSSAATLAAGRRDCSGKECLPYQLVWGAFRKQLHDTPPGRLTVLTQVTGQGACRNCLFVIKDRMTLEHLGMGDRVSVRPSGHDRDEGAELLRRQLPAMVAWDVFHQLAAYYRPVERAAGEVDRLHEDLCDRLTALAERRPPRGVAGMAAPWRYAGEVRALIAGAARAYAPHAARARAANGSLRTALLTGDIYLRADAFANQELVKRLNAHGLHVVLDGVCTFAEYLMYERSAEILGLPTGRVESTLYRWMSTGQRRALYAPARALHPWLPMPAVHTAIDEAVPVLGDAPVGEARITIGTVLDAWKRRTCDGIVVISPWGCGPALVAEGMLRHERDIPLLFLYADGSPMDQRRLAGFAYGLKRAPARVAPARRSA